MVFAVQKTQTPHSWKQNAICYAWECLWGHAYLFCVFKISFLTNVLHGVTWTHEMTWIEEIHAIPQSYNFVFLFLFSPAMRLMLFFFLSFSTIIFHYNDIGENAYQIQYVRNIFLYIYFFFHGLAWVRDSVLPWQLLMTSNTVQYGQERRNNKQRWKITNRQQRWNGFQRGRGRSDKQLQNEPIFKRLSIFNILHTGRKSLNCEVLVCHTAPFRVRVENCSHALRFVSSYLYTAWNM